MIAQSMSAALRSNASQAPVINVKRTLDTWLSTVEVYNLDRESAKRILKQVVEELRKAKDEGVNPTQIVQNVRSNCLRRRRGSISTSRAHSIGRQLYSLGTAILFVNQMTQGAT